MPKSGRSLRLGRLLKGDEAPLLLVPLDHTVSDGPFTDAHRYDHLLGTSLAGRFEAASALHSRKDA